MKPWFGHEKKVKTGGIQSLEHQKESVSIFLQPEKFLENLSQHMTKQQNRRLLCSRLRLCVEFHMSSLFCRTLSQALKLFRKDLWREKRGSAGFIFFIAMHYLICLEVHLVVALFEKRYVTHQGAAFALSLFSPSRDVLWTALMPHDKSLTGGIRPQQTN